ncbi:MAG: hypothetical protein LAO51_05135 [Acidobacteriia bacterium]|nr:hypothetical protein [Terriglobia bacterium]
MSAMCGARIATGTCPLKRVTAGRGGKTSRSAPRANRTWYSSFPDGGWCGRVATSHSPSRTIGAADQGSLVGNLRHARSAEIARSSARIRTGWSPSPPWERSRRTATRRPPSATSPSTGYVGPVLRCHAAEASVSATAIVQSTPLLMAQVPSLARDRRV